MNTMKDYAPYLRRKQEWREQLEALDKKVQRSLFAVSIVILCFAIWLH